MPNGSSKLACTVPFGLRFTETHCESSMGCWICTLSQRPGPASDTCSRKWLFLIRQLQWLTQMVRLKRSLTLYNPSFQVHAPMGAEIQMGEKLKSPSIKWSLGLDGRCLHQGVCLVKNLKKKRKVKNRWGEGESSFCVGEINGGQLCTLSQTY